MDKLRLELMKSSQPKSTPHFACGKFDLHQHSEPYSAFVSALTELCNSILALESEDRGYFIQIRDSIRQCLGDESTLLLQLMPNIKRVFEDDHDTKSMLGLEDFDLSQRKLRFNILIGRFFHAICKHGRPVVLYLDDLQWADTASLELIETILKDPNLSNLLFLGCYRENEVNQVHPLNITLEKIKNQTKGVEIDNKLNITRIDLGNLSLEDVHSLIKDLLNMDHKNTKGLAEIVFEKTNGNALFVVHFLSSLRDEELLTYSLGKTCWVWDVVEIREKTSITMNVVDLLKLKLKKKLPSYATRVLQIAAYFGSSFDLSIMELLAENMLDKERLIKNAKARDTTTVESCLKLCMAEGFIVDRSLRSQQGKRKQMYAFVHDEIQSAASSLVLSETKDIFKTRMGSILVDKLNKDELDKIIFVVVELLDSNLKVITDEEQQLLLARLNLQAGKKAKESSAFASAERYLNNALDILGPDCWDMDYALALELSTVALQVECSNSRYEKVQKRANEIMIRTNGRIQDSLFAYFVLGEAMHAQGLYEESVELYMKCLARLGVNFPRKFIKVAVISALKKTKELLQTLSSFSDMLDLPPMEDELRIHAMIMLDRTARAAYEWAGQSSNPIHACQCILISCKVMQWTVKYGIFKNSSIALLSYSYVHIALYKDIKGASQIFKVAKQMYEKHMSDRSNSPTTQASFNNISYLILNWIIPMKELRKVAMDGYRSGLEYGDNNGAMAASLSFIGNVVMTGAKLSRIKDDIDTYSQQMIDQKQNFLLPELKIYLYMVIMLMGHSDEATEGLLLPIEQRSSKMRVIELQLAVYFGDYESAKRLMKVAGHSVIAKVSPALPIVWRITMFEGVTAFAIARKSKGLQKQKWRACGIRIAKKVRKWVSQGNPNCIQIAHLLAGEQYALDGKIEEAKRKYDTAISIARRHGLRNDVALASERAGEMYLDVGDVEWGTHYIENARTEYKDWGAHGKVRQMLEKYDNLVIQM